MVSSQKKQAAVVLSLIKMVHTATNVRPMAHTGFKLAYVICLWRANLGPRLGVRPYIDIATAAQVGDVAYIHM